MEDSSRLLQGPTEDWLGDNRVHAIEGASCLSFSLVPVRVQGLGFREPAVCHFPFYGTPAPLSRYIGSVLCSSAGAVVSRDSLGELFGKNIDQETSPPDMLTRHWELILCDADGLLSKRLYLAAHNDLHDVAFLL